MPSAEFLRGVRRVVEAELQRISPRIPREELSRTLIRELAFSRTRTLRSALRDRVQRVLPFSEVFDEVCNALIAGGLLKAEPATKLVRGDLLSAPSDEDGRSVFTSDGWCEVSEALWVMLDALSFDFDEHEPSIQRIRRALTRFEVDDADDLIEQGWGWLTRDGLLRATLESDFGDPRPVVYFIWDEANGLDRPGVADRLRAWASELFPENPYRAHLVVVLERSISETEAEPIVWAVRRSQLAGFDTATIVWDLTCEIVRTAGNVETLQSVAHRLAVSSRRAKLEVQVLTRVDAAAAVSEAQAVANHVKGELIVVASGDRDLARFTRLQGEDPACEIVVPRQEIALQWLQETSDPDELAMAMRAIFASNECRMGDTFTIRDGQPHAGCPLGCAGSVAELGVLREGLVARRQDAPAQTILTPRINRGRRRRCI